MPPRYARVSGDYNPIHLSGLTARLFGFRRAIAHGMWTLAGVAAELQPRVAAGGTVLKVAFKLPVLLPGRVAFHEWPVERGFGFALLDAAGERPHAVGTFGAAQGTEGRAGGWRLLRRRRAEDGAG